MKKTQEKEYVWVTDLSKPLCHVCGKPMMRDTTPNIENEHCVNPICMVRNIKFHIPHKEIEVIV